MAVYGHTRADPSVTHWTLRLSKTFSSRVHHVVCGAGVRIDQDQIGVSTMPRQANEVDIKAEVLNFFVLAWLPATLSRITWTSARETSDTPAVYLPVKMGWIKL